MWFAFGLVGLVVAFAWQVRHRWTQPWPGSDSFTTPGTYSRFLSRKNSTYGYEVGVRVPPAFRFELKRETWVDRFFKWVGLSVEEQIGEERFDRLVYVASDDRHLVNCLAGLPELRRSAMLLFLSGTGDCTIGRVTCAHGWLVVRIRRRGLTAHKDDTKHLVRCGMRAEPHLRAMTARLRAAQAPTEAAPARRDPYLFRSVALVAASTALTVHGALFLVRPLFFDDAFTVDRWRIFELSLVCGAALLGLLVAANFVLLGRSARAHLVLLELLLVGSFGAVASSAAELRDANIEWDTAAPRRFETPIASKSISRSRRSGTRYRLHVKDWDDPGSTRSIDVSSGFYGSVQPGQRLVVEEHPGRFGARWARVAGAAAAGTRPER